jgi:hypothetical protein
VEIRGFGLLKQLFEQRGWDFPYQYKIEGEMTALALARQLDLPLERIEAVFINGHSHDLDTAVVQLGDRVGFVPYGTPGVARLLLGIKREPEQKK